MQFGLWLWWRDSYEDWTEEERLKHEKEVKRAYDWYERQYRATKSPWYSKKADQALNLLLCLEGMLHERLFPEQYEAIERGLETVRW